MILPSYLDFSFVSLHIHKLCGFLILKTQIQNSAPILTLGNFPFWQIMPDQIKSIFYLISYFGLNDLAVWWTIASTNTSLLVRYNFYQPWLYPWLFFSYRNKNNVTDILISIQRSIWLLKYTGWFNSAVFPIIKCHSTVVFLFSLVFN